MNANNPHTLPTRPFASHAFVVTYSWRFFFRRVWWVKCWHCDAAEGPFPSLDAATARLEQKEAFA